MVKDGSTRYVYAKESGLAQYQFTCETIDVYSCGVYDGMLDLDPFAPLDELTQGLSNHCIKQPQILRSIIYLFFSFVLKDETTLV